MIRAKMNGPLVRKVWAVGLLVAALMAASFLLDTKPAQADTTFTVTRTDDFKDPDLGDGQCGFFSARGGRACTLRAAMEQANATSGIDTINFNVPGTGVKTILPASELPDVTAPVVIDGYTQPGAKKNTRATGALDAVILVELDGTTAGSGVSGLNIRASNVLVRGLAINRFENGIDMAGGTANKIEGNFIGTDATGTLDRGNGDGVDVVVGGNHTIGGALPDKRNLISGNNALHVRLDSGTGANKVQGNLMGVQKDGTSSLGGNSAGIGIASPKNTIGGAQVGQANVIANGLGKGVAVFSTGNSILSNSIFSNKSLGIDLQDNGRTLNDPKDPDTGANTLQNFPVLSSAVTSTSGITTVTGELNSTPGKTFTVQFFSSPRGEDEGKTFIGHKSVTTDAQGKASFTFQPSQALSGLQSVTATATNSEGNTSEFSDPVGVVTVG